MMTQDKISTREPLTRRENKEKLVERGKTAAVVVAGVDERVSAVVMETAARSVPREISLSKTLLREGELYNN